MAYRNFSEITVTEATVETRSDAATRTDVNGFSPLEWSVVALAERDTLASLETPGRMATALGALFGGRRNPRLADPRLEALRRFVVIARHLRDRLPDREIVRFLSAGFSHAQAQRLRPQSFAR